MSWIPDNVTDCIVCAQLELEKGWLLMGLLIQEYPFDAEPDKIALICDYKQMAVFMDYIHDSIVKINKFMKQAIELDRGGVSND